MSRIDTTTQELFLRLGQTSLSRSTRADAVFRRLRSSESDQLASELAGAPRRTTLASPTLADTPNALRQR